VDVEKAIAVDADADALIPILLSGLSFCYSAAAEITEAALLSADAATAADAAAAMTAVAFG